MQFLSSTGLLYPQSPMLLFWFVLCRISRQNALVLHPFLTMLPKATPIFQSSYLEAQSSRSDQRNAVQYSTLPFMGWSSCEATDFSIRKCFLAAGLTMLRHIPCRRTCGPVHTHHSRPTVLQYVLKKRLSQRLHRLLAALRHVLC